MSTNAEPMPKRIPLRILLLWHSLRSGNLGVGALALGHIALLNRAAERAECNLQFDIAGWGDELDYRSSCHNLGCQVHAGGRELFARSSTLNSLISQADLVLDIGSGDSFSDIYGTRRFLAMSLVRLRALMQGVPFVFAPQTIGPFSNFVNRWIAKRLLNRSRGIFARDGRSFQALRDMGISRNVFDSIDVAFRLPFQRTSIHRRTDKRKIGVSISALLYHGGYEGRNQFGLAVDYAMLTHNLLSMLTEDQTLDVHLIPHVVSTSNEVEDDYLLAKHLNDNFPDTILPTVFRTPTEAKSYISDLDLLIGSRMHATIAAFSSGVPVIPLAYSRKFQGLFGSLGYSTIVDLTIDSEETAINRIADALGRLDELKELVEAGNSIAEQKLNIYEDYISSIFVQLSGQGT